MKKGASRSNGWKTGQLSVRVAVPVLLLTVAASLCAQTTTNPRPVALADGKPNRRWPAALVSGPDFEFPDEAIRQGLEGRGVCHIDIDRQTGAVTKVTMLRSTGSAILDDATTSACRRYRFKPGTFSSVTFPISWTQKSGGKLKARR